MADRLKQLSDFGVSVWLDDLSRERLDSGNLERLVSGSSVVGVTTNPTIFASALSKGEAYNAQITQLAASGMSVADAIRVITTDDVRAACDVFAGVYAATGGYDGRVSIEVEPGLAMDTEATTAQAAELFELVDRPNVLIKIPATEPGLAAITSSIAAGISVNVTLIFALDRYRAVIEAYLDGLEQAVANGRDIGGIHSVASFFVSRVDTEVDQRLDSVGEDAAARLKGQAGVANARLAFALYQQQFASDRFTALAAKGANRQRPLWASTGVKDPSLPDTMYVSELAVAGTVNTMPEKTLQAFADHGVLDGDKVSGTDTDARQVLDQLAAAGIDYDDVVDVLEAKGLQKFAASWAELSETVQTALEDAAQGKDNPGGDVDAPADHDTIV